MRIKEALKILAETRDNQVAYLEGLGTSPLTDELVLQYDDSYQVFIASLEDRYSDTLIMEGVLKNLDAISSIFDQMDDKSDNSVWDIASLDSDEWDNVRKLALETIPFLSDLEA